MTGRLRYWKTSDSTNWAPWVYPFEPHNWWWAHGCILDDTSQIRSRYQEIHSHHREIRISGQALYLSSQPFPMAYRQSLDNLHGRCFHRPFVVIGRFFHPTQNWLPWFYRCIFQPHYRNYSSVGDSRRYCQNRALRLPLVHICRAPSRKPIWHHNSWCKPPSLDWLAYIKLLVCLLPLTETSWGLIQIKSSRVFLEDYVARLTY